MVLPSGTLSQTLNVAYFSAFFRHGTLTVATVVNLVGRTTVASFVTLSVHLCLRHDGRDTARRAASSAIAAISYDCGRWNSLN